MMITRKINTVITGLLFTVGDRWRDATYEFPVRLVGDVAAALRGGVIAAGFVIGPVE